MKEQLTQFLEIMQNLVSRHAQLFDMVDIERETLIQANINEISILTDKKQKLIEEIQQIENQRIKATQDLAQKLQGENVLGYQDLLNKIPIEYSKIKEGLETAFSTLILLIQRISEKNKTNQGLVEKSLAHIHQMKKNILNQSQPHSVTYSQQGQKVGTPTSSKIFSQTV